ncbi:MAG: M6 family metalloprotease domain-containing protein [Bacteroidales bacterium]|nr:M6 family metalloprotease domain-containing protein [Bacteroidales bacterium]
MKSKYLPILIILVALVVSGSSPRKGTFLMYQPDGTSFLATLKGDEFAHVLTTADGYAVTKGEDGFYWYAYFNSNGSRTSSGYKVGSEVPSMVLSGCRSIPWQALRNISAEKRINRRGYSRNRLATRASSPIRKHCIVLLAQFQDKSFMNGDSRRQEFIDLITKENSRSVLDYFNDQFNGEYEFNFTVGPIVTLSKDMAYYGKNEDDKAGQDSFPQELVKEACTLSDPYVDFSQFDDDHDGIVDNVFVIVAGKSEAEGADSDCMWPHQWYVPNLNLDGKKILTYALSTELTVHSKNSSGQLVWGLCSIGTFCHEYSHVIGLEDYYDTDEEGSGGLSNSMWTTTALMDGGNFNDIGRTPPFFNALDREILGIGRPEKMEPGTVNLEPIDRNGRYLILENPNDSSEFFLFECRSAKGWDMYIGGSGLAIYHVDMSRNFAGWSDDAGRNVNALYRWENNEVNCNPSYECADMIETSAGAIDVRQAFFPYRTINSFNANSKPAFKFNDGTESPFAIAGITRYGENVIFTVYNSSDIVPNVQDLQAEVYQDAAIITWQSDIEGFEGEASVTWGETSGSKTTLTVTPYEAGKYSLTLENLSPTKAYTVNVSFKRNEVTGETSVLDFLTKATQEGKRPYIFLEYLSVSRNMGKFIPGTGFPLRVYNAIGEKVGWTYDGKPVQTDASGYFHPSKSGTLKATVYHSDGSRDILSKEIVFQ